MSILKDYVKLYGEQELLNLKDKIYNLYINENMNWSEISNILNIDVRLIRSICEKFNIKKDKKLRYKRVSESRENTFINKYGVNNIFSLKEIQDKIHETNIRKYGVKSLLELEEIRKLGRDKAILNAIESNRRNIPDSVKSIIYDENNFANFLESIDYSERTFQEMYKRLEYYSTTVDHQYYKFKLDLKYPINRGINRSIAENSIKDFILSLDNNIKIIENCRSVIPPLEIDLYLPEYNLGIEFNGNYWHSDLVMKSSNYHFDKSMKCKSKGIFLYHIWEYEWNNDIKREIVKSQIRNLLMKSKKIYARKCEIREVSSSDAMNFLNINHIQGKRGSSIRIGLYYNNELVSIMTFGMNKFIRKNSENIELLRFCNKLNTTVVGGASKLFKYFIDNYDYDNIISYCDISKGRGNLYENLGFNLLSITSTNYLWVNLKTSDIKSRYQTQMKDEDLIMRSNNYAKIFNCGNYKFIYNR